MEKAIKVIKSCLTLEQLEKAKNYQFLFFDSIGWDPKVVEELRTEYLEQYIKLLRSC